MGAYVANPGVLTVNVFIPQLFKAITIISAANRILPGYVHMIPVPVQLNQVPGMCRVMHIASLKAAGLGGLQKGIRVAGTLSPAVYNAAVSRGVLPAGPALIRAVFHQPLDNQNLLLKVAHAVGQILILKGLDGRLRVSPLILAHLGIISVFKIIGPQADGAVGIILPGRVVKGTAVEYNEVVE